ncbi:MAG TPA: YceI family protein [Mycobacteriales bacterium]|nr:YceI family protein [Mycobacteriales bacterium]
MPSDSDGLVTGSVVTRDGWPVPHAVVTVVDAVGGQVGRSGVGPDGRFAVNGLTPGAYTVITAAVGHAPQARTAVVSSGRSAQLGALVLSPAGGTVLPAPGRWRIDPVHSTIGATTVHLGFSKIHGRFTEFAGTIELTDPLENSRVEVVIESRSVDTGNDMRDGHLRSPDFLDVERHPRIRYVGHELTLQAPDRGVLDGELTMKEVTRPVRLYVGYLGSGADPWGGTRAGFSATTQLDRDEFGIIWNQSLLAGVFAVGRTLRVELDVQAIRED